MTIKKLWKNKELRWGVLWLLLGILLVTAVGKTYIADEVKRVQYVPYNDRVENDLQLQEGETVQTDFICREDQFYGLKLFLKEKARENADNSYDGRLVFTILDSLGDTIYTRELALEEFSWDNEGYEIPLEQPLSECSGKKFSVCVTLQQGDQGHDIFMGQAEAGELHVQLGVDQYTFLKGAYTFLAIVFLIGIVVIYYLMTVKKAPLHQIYIPIAVVLGIFYCALIPPFMVPDERVHYEQSYEMSNFFLGTGNAEEGMIYMRSEDAAFPFQEYSEIDTYKAIYENIWRIDKENSITSVQNLANTYSVGYVVPGIGLAIGRLLHLGTVLTYWLARWANYLVFMVFVCLGIKRTPVGKNIVLTFAMLPMVMQGAMSVSYDCVAFGLSILVITQCMKMAFGEGRIALKDLIWYTVPAILLAGLKGGAYLPVCFTALIVPVKRFSNIKRYLSTVAVILILTLAGFLISNLGMLRSVVAFDSSVEVPVSEKLQLNEENIQDVMNAGTEVHYSVSDILHHPGNFVKVLMSSMLGLGDFYLRSMIGSPLGWLDIEIPWWILCGYMGVLLFSTIEPGGVLLTGKQKIWFLLMAGAIVFLILLSMFLAWTPVGSTVVQGVQGRYFLPALPLLLLSLRNGIISSRRSLSSYLIHIMLCLQVVTWFYIAKAVL